MRAKGTLKVRPWLRLTNNMSVSVIDAYEPKHQKNNSQIPRLINHTAMPLSPVKNPDGTWTAAAAKSGYAAFSEGTSWRTNDYVYLRNKFDVNIDLVKDVLTASVDYSYNYTNRKRMDAQTVIEYSKKPGEILYESEAAGSNLQSVEYQTRYQSANAYLNWSPKLGDDHTFKALAGWNIEKQKYETLTSKREGFVTASKPSFGLMNGTTTDPTVGGYIWSYVGAFFRLNYGYKGKYLAEVSGRYDGSSKFPTNSKWGFFPSASVAWRVSEEPWMKWSEEWLDNFKIRLSAGSMGNGNVDPYSYTSEMTVVTASDIVLGGGLPSYTTVGSTVPVSLTWEKSTTYDLGLDLDFLNNRLVQRRLLPPLHHRHVHAQHFAAVGLRHHVAQGQQRRTAHYGLGAVAHMARLVQAGRQAVRLQHQGDGVGQPDGGDQSTRMPPVRSVRSKAISRTAVRPRTSTKAWSWARCGGIP